MTEVIFLGELTL